MQRTRAVTLLLAATFATAAWAQDPPDKIRIDLVGNGDTPKVAVPDLSGTGDAQNLMTAFNQTVWSDLEDCGMVNLVPKNVYPLSIPAQPTSLRAAEWGGAPTNAKYLALGYSAVQAGLFVFRGWFVELSSGTQIVAAVYNGPLDEAGARKTAHEFAADIIRKFGGTPLYNTHIYFRSKRNGVSEIWVMDPDGSNQRPVTKLSGLVMGPAVSPDGSRLAFTSGWPKPPHVTLFSIDPTRELPFRTQESTLSTSPTFTPDGRHVLYSISIKGNCCAIYIADLDGSNARQIAPANSWVNTEPKVNPKTGADVLFVSGRSGPQQIYRMNIEGADVERLTPGEGQASNPAWHPNGQHFAFAWTQGFAPGKFNIFLMDAATHQYDQLTKNTGRNENPSFSPDGNHIVFMSTRSGSAQIWTMLANGKNFKQLTTQGINETPAWSK